MRRRGTKIKSHCTEDVAETCTKASCVRPETTTSLGTIAFDAENFLCVWGDRLMDGQRKAWLMVMVAALLLCSGAVGRADDADDKAVAHVEKLSGTVKRDERKAGRPAIEVSLCEAAANDDDLKKLAAFRQLQVLDLTRTRTTDRSLKELVGFQQLHPLTLLLKDLAGLKSLNRLSLNKTPIDDANVKHLAALGQLNMVDLVRTRVTKQGVAQLQKALPSLAIVGE
jgi:hypothetical protein